MACHVCVPLLSLSQQAADKPLFIEHRVADDRDGAHLRPVDSSLNDVPNSYGAPLQTSSHLSATGADVARRVAMLSRALSSCLGLRPGGIVLLVAQAGCAMMESMLAALDAGAVLCPVNWRWTPSELVEAVDRVGSPAVVLYDQACAELALKALELMGAKETCGSAKPKCRGAGGNAAGASPTCSAGRARPWAVAIDHWNAGACSNTSSGAGMGSPTSSGAAPLRATTTSELLRLAAAALPLPSPTSQSAPAAPGTPAPALQLLTSPCSTAMLVFTSGTTSAPKAVMLSHTAFHTQSLVKLALVRYGPTDTYLHLAPLFHIGGLSSAHAALMAGCTHVFLPRFAPGAALEAMDRHRVTAFIAVPTMLQDMAAEAAAAAAAAAAGTGGVAEGKGGPGAVVVQARQRPLDLRCVRRVLVGAGGTSSRLQEAVGRTFPCAELLSAYGMTEACSSITFRHLRDPTEPPNSCQGASSSRASHGADRRAPQPDPLPPGAANVGWPAPGLQVMVVPLDQQAGTGATGSGGGSSGRSGDGDGGRPAGSSTPVGEVLTRGPHLMSGYWRDPGATAQALTPDGWLRTGDLGYLCADGSLVLLGRAKDMVKSGGENVFAPQVEAVLALHPAVAAAAVVGLPDERLGEQVAALLVLHPGWAFDGPMLSGGQPLPLKPSPASGSTDTPSAHTGTASTTSLQELQAFARQQGLAGFRLPRFAAAQREGLPVNGSGKVVKAVVREALAAARAAAAEGGEGGTRFRSKL